MREVSGVRSRGRQWGVGGGIGVVGAAMLLIAAPGSVGAQGALNPGCRAAAVTFRDACQKTVDIFDYLAPQLGTALAGGNANLGQASALGGLGHFSIGIRANAVDGDVPKVDNVTVSTTGPVADNFALTRVPVPMVTADAGIGLFKGLPLGVTHVLGVDALISALYIPHYSNSNVAVRPDHPLKLGFGGRLGIFAESRFVPGVSVTYLQRDLPQTTVVAVTGADSLRVQNLDVSTRAWRVVVGKHLLFLGLAGGYGRDQYRASTGVSAEVSGVSSGTASLASPSMTMSRTNYFGDLSLNFPVVKFGVEIGKVSGGTIPTYNGFVGKPAGAARLYGSAGVRINI